MTWTFAQAGGTTPLSIPTRRRPAPVPEPQFPRPSNRHRAPERLQAVSHVGEARADRLARVEAGSLGAVGPPGQAAATVPGQGGGLPANGRIAYVVDSKGCDDCHVFTVMPDGSGRVRLTDHAAGGPEWSPDGARLIFSAIAEDGRRSTPLFGSRKPSAARA
jgi:hypothetical protein